jgi:hypothetical protein
MFYWSRHLVPYDLALCFALASAAVACEPGFSWKRSLLAGVLSTAAFVTYNGYWAIGACVLTAHVLRAAPRRAAGRACFALAGLAGSFALMLALIRLAGYDLLPKYREFAGTITEGNFNEGHIVFFDYLWRSERATAVLWAGAFIASLGLIARAPAGARGRGLTWAASIAALAVILIGGANYLHQFVVYGRLVRQVAPFCALLVGWVAGRIWTGPSRTEAWGLGVLLACAALAMSKPLRQQYPLTFQAKAERTAAAYRAAHPEVAASRFHLLYAVYLWPLPDEKPLPAGTRILLASPHPLAWRPYLYEGFNHDQRAAIEAVDVTMRLALLPP